jgi:hypothetical protein
VAALMTLPREPTMKFFSTLLALCGALGLLASAHAGVTVTLQGEKDHSTIYVEGNKMRVDSEPASGHKSTMIFDGDQQKMLLIDHEKKAFSEVTPQAVKGVQAQARQRAQEQMAKLSPEQRKQMEQLMTPEQRKQLQDYTSGQAEVKPVDIKWELTGAKQTVAGFPCEGFKELKDGKLNAEGCYIPWSAGAITKADLAPVHKLQEFMTQSGLPVPQHGLANFMKLEEGPGFPGSWERVSESGQKEHKESVSSVKRGSVSSDKFQLPPSYTKTDSFAGMK